MEGWIDNLQSIYAHLSAQASLCALALEEEQRVISDLFIGRMRETEIQKKMICRKGRSDEMLKAALEI